MNNDHADQSREQRARHTEPEHDWSAGKAQGGQAEALGSAADLPSIVNNPALSASVNASVRGAVLQRMQQTYGNRATRSFVQRHPVEQDEEYLKKPEPTVQAMRANLSPVSIQRDPPDTATTTPPATTPPAPAVLDAPSTDVARIETIKTAAKSSAIGAAAMTTVTDKSVPIVFGAAGGGSSFSGSANKITLDPGQKNADLALVLVHEATHAEYFHKNLTANTVALLRSLPKDDYVNKMITEETEATVRQIEAKGEIEAAGGTGASTQAGETSYKKAYKTKYDAEKAASKPEADAKAAARLAGAAAVKKDFEEGITIKTSTTGESYKVFYQKAWDRFHPPTP